MIRGINGLLHIGSVKVDLDALGQVLEATGEAENVVEQRTGRGDLVDIKAGVNKTDSVVNVGLELTARHAIVGVRRRGQQILRRKSESLLYKCSVAVSI